MVPDDPATVAGRDTARRLEVVRAGHRGDAATARAALSSQEESVREAALSALARARRLTPGDLVTALHDASPGVRRRACDLASTLPPGRTLDAALRQSLRDRDPLVAEAACWALGEHRAAAAVEELSDVARSHDDARTREAAVAALGAIGDERGLPAVVGALGDRPAVRRRAVVALAGFEGDEAAAAIRRGATDRDWQVREVAEILLGADGQDDGEARDPG